jgi:hypothetical protein
MRRFVIRQTNRMTTLQRGTMIMAGVSVIALATYFMIGVSSFDSSDSLASDGSQLLANDPVNNGMILCGFTWEMNDPTRSDIGPSAESISRNAEIVAGGKDGSHALSAGNTGKNLNLTIAPNAVFNTDGIDFSIDFRRFEPTGNFISRGKTFWFGIREGRLCIKYTLRQENGRAYEVEELTRYEVPSDTLFRTYRFIYNPAESRGEVFVDNAPVWSHTAEDGDKLVWKQTDPLVIGDGINGGSLAKAVIDNVVFRSTSRARTLPLQLLSFSAELRGKEVMLTWFTGKEDGVDSFRVERSFDTYSYQMIGMVKASGVSKELKAYALLDTQPAAGISYYRLSLPGTDVRSVWVPVIALKIKELPADASSAGSR